VEVLICVFVIYVLGSSKVEIQFSYVLQEVW
jgi:hypothetical protein